MWNITRRPNRGETVKHLSLWTTISQAQIMEMTPYKLLLCPHNTRPLYKHKTNRGVIAESDGVYFWRCME